MTFYEKILFLLFFQVEAYLQIKYIRKTTLKNYRTQSFGNLSKSMLIKYNLIVINTKLNIKSKKLF